LHVSVQGKTFHPSRTVVMLNEDPLYIEFTTSAFGFVGRSVYQRPFFLLRSFLQTMLTDDFVSRKAGVLVAKLEQPGSIINQAMAAVGAIKRVAIKMARNNNVISIGKDEAIESLNLQNLDGAASMARKNIIDNIAAASDGMPAKLLNSETFAEGFGEGTEDAKAVAHYVDRIRRQMHTLYDFFDQVCMRRAWTPEFYASIQEQFPDQYADVDFNTAFYEWKNAFKATFPSFLTEPDSKKVEVDKVKMEAVVSMVEVLMPALDPANKATLVQWAADSFNSLKILMPQPLELDAEALADYVPPTPEPGATDGEGPREPEPMALHDSASTRGAILKVLGRRS
jgi:hypothetical protein